MDANEALYDEPKPDIVALVLPLLEVSQRFLKARNNFLPHGAVLTEEGKVNFVMAASENDITNSTEVLPLLHEALRRSAQFGVKALALAENGIRSHEPAEHPNGCDNCRREARTRQGAASTLRASAGKRCGRGCRSAGLPDR